MVASLLERAEAAVTPVTGFADEASSSAVLPSGTANHVTVSPLFRLSRLPSTEASPTMPYSRSATVVRKTPFSDAGEGGVVRLMVVAASAVKDTSGEPSATMTVPRAVPAASVSSIVTEASSYATTVGVTAVGNAAETSALGPAVIVSAPL